MRPIDVVLVPLFLLSLAFLLAVVGCTRSDPPQPAMTSSIEHLGRQYRVAPEAITGAGRRHSRSGPAPCDGRSALRLDTPTARRGTGPARAGDTTHQLNWICIPRYNPCESARALALGGRARRAGNGERPLLRPHPSTNRATPGFPFGPYAALAATWAQ